MDKHLLVENGYYRETARVAPTTGKGINMSDIFNRIEADGRLFQTKVVDFCGVPIEVHEISFAQRQSMLDRLGKKVKSKRYLSKLSELGITDEAYIRIGVICETCYEPDGEEKAFKLTPKTMREFGKLPPAEVDALVTAAFELNGLGGALEEDDAEGPLFEDDKDEDGEDITDEDLFE